jgi:hypothetical protein
MPRLIRRAFDGETVQLSRDMRLRLKRHEDLAGEIIGSVVFEMAVSKLLRTSYVSETELPIEILSAVSGDRDLARRNSLVQKHLTSIVPFIGDARVVSSILNEEIWLESFFY